MKNAFREQVAMLFSWFKTWSDCEQTVAIYSLLKRSSPVQAKFLQQVLQHVLTDCNDVKEMEEKANDEEYVRSLRSKEKGVLHQLLQLFPLLKVGNNSAKAAYLDLIPEHLSHTILNGVNVEESRQLISFSLIHPALSPEEREPLHGWLVYLDDRLTYSNSNNFQNFNNANIGSSNRLAVGSSSSSSSGGSNNPSHSPSPVSPSHRSISQTSLCQENANQDYNQILPATNNTTNPNMLSPHILPKHSHSNTSQSPTPSIGIWQQQQSLQQQQQQHPQIPQGLSSGIDSGQGFNKVPGNFNNSNSLVVGHNSGGNSMSYNPLSVSLGQRSISQTSLCQDSQDHAPINSSGMRPLSGHSPGPSVHQWQQQQQQQQSNQQQLFQHSYQANQTALEPSPGHISLSGSNSDISRYSGQYNASSGNSHRTLRASNSHNMGAVEAPRGHMPLKATASAPPNFNSSSSKYQDKFSYPSSTGQKSHARLSRTRSLVPPSRWQGRDSQAPNASTSGSSSSLWWRQHPSKSSIGGGGGSTGHAPLSPQSSVTSSESSDSHHEDGPPTNDDFQEGPSRDLLLWLKEIRLHKYAYLFRNMTYEELPNLSEEWLLQNNVVRGARQRFMINIVKLRERQTLLRQLEKSIKGDESISQVLHELKAVLQTPIGPFDPEQQTHKQQPSSSSSSSGGDIDLTELHTSTTTTAATTTATTSTTNPTTPSSTSSSTGPESTTTTNTISESTSLSSSSSSSSSSTVTTLTTTSLSTTTPSAVPSSTSSSSSPSSPPTSTSSPSSQQPEASSDESGDGIAEGDLPSQIFRLLGKVCQELLRATGRDQHSFQMYLMLVRMVLHHDAFTADQKKSLESQVRTAEKLWRPTPHFYRPNTSWWRGKTYPVCDSYGSRVIPRSKRDPAPDSYQQQQLHWRQQQQQRQFQQQQQQQQQRQSQHHHATYHPPHHNYHQQQHHQQQQHVGVGVGGHQSWTSSGGGSSSASFRPGSQGGMGGHQAVTRNSSWNPAYLNKPGLMEPPTKQPLSRTQSAPINRPLTLPTHTPSVIGDDMEINASLDSLCEQMTEQALGNYEQGDVSKGSGFSMR